MAACSLARREPSKYANAALQSLARGKPFPTDGALPWRIWADLKPQNKVKRGTRRRKEIKIESKACVSVRTALMAPSVVGGLTYLYLEPAKQPPHPCGCCIEMWRKESAARHLSRILRTTAKGTEVGAFVDSWIRADPSMA